MSIFRTGSRTGTRTIISASLPAPKTHFSKDLEFSRDTPIFCTTKHDLVFVRGGAVDEKETETMAGRWRSFEFQRQIQEAEQLAIPSCARCFSELVSGARE